MRAKAEQHLRGGRATIDASATLARYLRWWVEEELAERVAEGMIVSTTRQQYANKVKHQIVPLLGHIRLRELSVMQLRQWLTTLSRQGSPLPPDTTPWRCSIRRWSEPSAMS